MTNDYVIAIPSYKRAKTLKEKTLALLNRYSIPNEKIRIFVANKEEKEIYGNEIPDFKDCLVVGKPGMMAIRNFIQDYFDEGKRVLNMDDDIEKIEVRVNEFYTERLKNFDRLVKRGFDTAELIGASLWGIYPMVNAGFMYHQPSKDLRYIVGAFWGVINTHDKDTYVTMDDKEDFERTIKFYIRDGKVLRFNHIGIKSAYYTEPGGMQETRTEERVRASGMALIEKYPMFCEFNKARKKHFEIRLVDRRKMKGR